MYISIYIIIISKCLMLNIILNINIKQYNTCKIIKYNDFIEVYIFNI